MAIKVKTLTRNSLEREADLLRAEYAEMTGSPIEIPVPVAEIVEYHLALQLGFADMHEILEVPKSGDTPDILGAIWIEDRAILIDRSLDPQSNPSMAGRYRFSVAHEAAHWWLHRSYVGKKTGQSRVEPTIICRSSQVPQTWVPIEWQADTFASCLLIPKERILEAWMRQHGSAEPFAFDPFEHGSGALRGHWIGLRADGQVARKMYAEECDRVFDTRVSELADKFGVSAIAMRIRLEGLGLLLRARRGRQAVSAA